MGIVVALLIFSVLILFHEFGHFLLAKKNGIVVTEFSLGMGPRIVSTVRGDTRYSWKLLPFGGSCMMLGEDGEDSGEGTFASKSVGARISVIAAGPIFNFIMAFFASIVVIGVIGYDPAEVLQVTEGSNAEAVGLQEGDIIKEFQGKNIYIGRDLNVIESLDGIKEGTYDLTYERDGEEYTVAYTPDTVERYMLGFSYNRGDSAEITAVTKGGVLESAGIEVGDKISAVDGNKVASGKELAAYMEEHPLSSQEVKLTYNRDGLDYDITVTPQMTTYTSMGFAYNLGRVKTSAIGVLKYSCIEVGYWIKLVYKSLAMLVTGQFSVKDLSGPVGVVTVIDETYNQSQSEGALYTWMNMLNLLILLSANLGVMNLLPLPALDGGRLVFLIIEAIRGKAINREAEGMVHFVGLVLLMILMVFIMYNDIQRLF